MKLGLLFLSIFCFFLVGCATKPPHREKPQAKEPPSPSMTRLPPDSARAHHDEKAQHCVALTMYWEARGEGQRGMVAVGAVVLNRVASRDFPNDACSVVYQGGETPPCQFSWWCDGRSDRPQNAKQWSLAKATAGDLLAGRFADPTHGALFFHSTGIQRPWKREQTARIGRHLFYR